MSKYNKSLPDFNKFTVDIFIQKAKQFAWPLGTDSKKYNYSTGSRKPEFTDALYKAFPKYKGKSEAYKKGASCSVFIATIVRITGLDKSFLPSKTLEMMQKRTDLWEPISKTNIKAGDIVYYPHTGGYHILMYGGLQSNSKHLWYQANANKQYPYTLYGSSINSSKYKKSSIFRPKKSVKNYIELDDIGTQPKLLQEFLNWYGEYNLELDGIIGTKSEMAIKDFQTKENLVIDGKFGTKCLERAKSINKITTEDTVKVENNMKQKYQGNWPDWVTLTGEIIAENARQSAWPKGTSKSKYTYEKGDSIKDPNPKRYGIYGKNLDKAFPNRAKTWGKQTACGASCDVFASTIVVSSGYDKKVPRGLGGAGKGQYKHFAESDLWTDSKAYKKSQRKPGDYILFLNKTSGGHACISGGTEITYEAGYTSKRYGCTVNASTYDPNKKSIMKVYRATKPLRKYIQKGDRGEQTKCVQSFLNWAGFNCGTADGIAGEKTELAIKKFQEKYKLEVDGKFGEKCLKIAKTIEKEIKSKYTGKLPTKTVKLKSKGNQVKYLQNFLDWYDDYELIRDGQFGSLTEKAVKDFQKREGLKVDGIFGPKSIAKAKIVER